MWDELNPLDVELNLSIWRLAPEVIRQVGLEEWDLKKLHVFAFSLVQRADSCRTYPTLG